MLLSEKLLPCSVQEQEELPLGLTKSACDHHNQVMGHLRQLSQTPFCLYPVLMCDQMSKDEVCDHRTHGHRYKQHSFPQSGHQQSKGSGVCNWWSETKCQWSRGKTTLRGHINSTVPHARKYRTSAETRRSSLPLWRWRMKNLMESRKHIDGYMYPIHCNQYRVS